WSRKASSRVRSGNRCTCNRFSVTARGVGAQSPHGCSPPVCACRAARACQPQNREKSSRPLATFPASVAVSTYGKGWRVSELSSRQTIVLAWSRRAVIVVVQLMFVALSNWLAFLLRCDWDLPPDAAAIFWRTLPWLVVIRAATFVALRLHEGLWKYASVYDLRAIVAAVVCSSVGFAVFTLTPFGPAFYPVSIVIVDAVLLTILLGGGRLARRMLAEASHGRPGKRLLIFGAGDAGEVIVRDIKNSGHSRYQAGGVVDDEPAKVRNPVPRVPVPRDPAGVPPSL